MRGRVLGIGAALATLVVGTMAAPTAVRAQTTGSATVDLLGSAGAWSAWYRAPQISQSPGHVSVVPAGDGYGAIKKLTDDVLGGASVSLRAVVVSDDGRPLSNANANAGLQAFARSGIVGSAPITVTPVSPTSALITASLTVRKGRAATVLVGLTSVGGPWHVDQAVLTIAGGEPYDGSDDDQTTVAPTTLAPTTTRASTTTQPPTTVPRTTVATSTPPTTPPATTTPPTTPPPTTTPATTIPPTTKPPVTTTTRPATTVAPTTSTTTTTAAPTTTVATGSCTVRLRRVWDTENGFGGRITITNTGDDVDNWHATWHWPSADVYYFDVWNAFLTTYTGRDATVRAAFWNARFAHGQSVEMGYTLAGSPQIPEHITFNGALCRVVDDTTLSLN